MQPSNYSTEFLQAHASDWLSMLKNTDQSTLFLQPCNQPEKRLPRFLFCESIQKTRRDYTAIHQTLNWKKKKILWKYIFVPHKPPLCVQKNPTRQSHYTFGRLCYSYPTLVAWSRFNNGRGLTDSKTHKLLWWNVSHAVDGFRHWASRRRGVTLFNYIQLRAPVCLRGHSSPSSGSIWFTLQRKYEYELLFAQL